MSLQSLKYKFNSILSQYQNTYQEYIKSIDSSDNSLITIPNSFFYGKNIINTISNTSLENCESSCYSNSSCSGASFNSSLNKCSLNSGDGDIIYFRNSTAIVQKGLYYSYKLQKLNAQLISINKEMQSAASSAENKYQENKKSSLEHSQILHKNYAILNQEREHINKMALNYETLNQAYEDGSLNVTSNYYSYIALLFISILLVFLLIKFSFTGQQKGGGNNNFKNEAIFLFGIMTVFLALSKVYNNYSIYIFISIIVFAYIISKIKLNQ